VENKPNIGAGILVSVIIAVITLGFNTVVWLYQNQEKQDERLNDKADKADVSDRFTGSMQRLHLECEHEKASLREKIQDAKLEKNVWEAKASDCENRWLLHLKVCKCGDH